MARTKKIQLKNFIAWMVLFSFTFSGSAWSLPSSALSIQTSNLTHISIPESTGVIEETFLGDASKPTIVFIQDAHANPSAQKNIKSILETLSAEKGLSVVGVEGADSRINPELLNLLPDQKINLEVSRELLEEGRLSGTELFALENKTNARVLGVDDRVLYQENLSGYRRIAQGSEAIIPVLDKWKQDLKEKKKSVCDTRLCELEERKEFSSKSPQAILLYVAYLSKLSERVLNLDLASAQSTAQFPNAHRVLMLAQGANKSDNKLTREEILKIEGSIAGTKFFDELARIEKGIYSNLLISEGSKTFYVQSQVLDLLKRAILLEATRQDVGTLREVMKQVSLNELFANMPSGTEESISRVNGLLNQTLRFYDVAQHRDENFVTKISQVIKSGKLAGAVLVTGGFHREGITQLLKKNRFSYFVVSPQLSIFGENKYREIMTEKTSISALPLQSHSVDVPKLAAQEFLGGRDQEILNALRFVSLGTARAIQKNGGMLLPDWKDGVNARLKVGARLEAATLWSEDSVELLFDVVTGGNERWVEVFVHGNSVEVGGSYPVARGNSLGAEYGAKKILTREPARTAVILGGPDFDVLKETGKFFLSSNFEKTSNRYTPHNRIFDAFMRALIGDPNISLTDIFGVRDPEGFYDLLRGNTFHGEFPGQVSFDELTSTLKINGRDIRIHPSLPAAEALQNNGIQYLVDFTNIKHTGELQDQQTHRLETLMSEADLKKVFVVNPEADYLGRDSMPLVPGLNDDVIQAQKKQVISFATPLTQSAAHILALLKEKMKADVDYVSDLEIRTMNQRGDRELHKIDEHAMAAELHHLFPDFAPRGESVDTVSPIQAINLEAPFKGAAYVDIKLQLRDSAKIIAELRKIQSDLEAKEKEAKKLSEQAKTDKSLKAAADQAKKDAEDLKAKQEEIKKKYVKELNKIFKEAAEGPLKGVLRYAGKEEAINSLKLQYEKSLVVFDSEKSTITSGGQLILKFWVSDMGQGQAIAETVKRALVADQVNTSSEDRARIHELQQLFAATGYRAATNVIPAQKKPEQKTFLLAGEKKIKYGIQGGRGRIGKYILRLLWNNPNYEPAFLNGVENIDNLIHQLVVDEVHGLYPFVAKRKAVDGKPVDVVQLFDRESGDLRYEVPVFNYRMRTEEIEEDLEKRTKELSELNALKLAGSLEGDAAKDLDKRLESKRQEIAALQGRLDGFMNSVKAMAKGAETVFNATGVDMYIDNAFNRALQSAGVKRVILTAPKSYKNEKDKEKQKRKDKVHASVLFGTNEKAIDAALKDAKEGTAVISAVSCTTNGLGPGLAEYLTANRPSVLDAYFLTDHGFTISQGALFGAPQSGKSLRTANDPTLSALPEGSGANKAFVEAVPWMKGKIEGESARTANQDGSLVRTFIKMKFEKAEDVPSASQVNEFFKELANGKLKGIFGYEVVGNTSQLLGRSESSVFDPSLTKVVRGHDSVTVEIGEWYDNEGGYTQRVIDVERYAAMASRDIDPRTGARKEIPLVISAVKLPGNQRLQVGSEEYNEIVASIRQSRFKPGVAPKVPLMKQLLALLVEKRNPSVLKGKETESFMALIGLLRALSEESLEKNPVANPYVSGQEIQDIDIQLVDLGIDEVSFKTSKGNRYFGVSEYRKDTKKLILYLPDSFFLLRFADIDKNAAALQLVLMFLFQEVVGLSYDEALLAVSNYNSKATREAADGNTALPDLLQAMLDEVKKKAVLGDRESIEYLNKALDSEVSYVISDEIRRGLESRGRTPEEIQSIQAELSRIAFLVNYYVSLPMGMRLDEQTKKPVLNPLPSANPAQITVLQDDLNTEAPNAALLEALSEARLIAVANALAPVVYGYLGASARIENAAQMRSTDRLLDGVPVDETRKILEQLGRATEIVAAGGSVRDKARPHFSSGDIFGSGRNGYLTLNPQERKIALYENTPGAVSVAVYADSERALGVKLPPFYVNAFVGHLSRELSREEIAGVKSDLEKNPINPDDNPIEVISRWAQLNKKPMTNVVVHVLAVVNQRRHEQERIQLLEGFAKTPEGAGLTIHKIESGTFESALKSAWGDNNGKLHIYLSTSGAAEVQTAMVLAGKEHSYICFGVMSRQGLSHATDIRPENAYRFDESEQTLLDHEFPRVAGQQFTSGIVGNAASGDFDGAIVPITDNELLGLRGIKKIAPRVFEVTVLRVVRRTDQHLFRWIEKFRAEVDAVKGITWTPVQADTPKVSASSLGKSRIDKALAALLKDQAVGLGEGLSARQAGLKAYADAHRGGLFEALFSPETPNLGVTVTTTSIASSEAAVTRLLANKASVAILVRDQENEAVDVYAKLAENAHVSDRLILVDSIAFDEDDIKALITNIMSGGKFKIRGTKELVTLAKIAGKFATLGQGVKLDGYLKQHTVVLADREVLPDPNRVPGIQLISVDRNKLDAASWREYRLLASGIAMKLASAGKVALLPFEIQSALKPISTGVFGFQDDFTKMLASLWNEFQGYQLSGQSA